MNMGTIVPIIVAVGAGVAIAGYFFLRRPHATPNKYGDNPSPAGARQSIQVTRNAPPKRDKRYYGVSVRPGTNCCDAIKAIAHERYLQGEAPQLPLPGCDREECRCVMRPENDRRTQIDRRADAFSAYGDYRPGEHPQRRYQGEDRRR